MDIDQWTRVEIAHDIDRIQKIVETGILEPSSMENPLATSAFMEILIHLRDLIFKCERYSRRITFTDDVVITKSIKDVTDLIIYVRHAICHIDSPKHLRHASNIPFTYNVIFGKGVIRLGGEEINSDYDDDTCYFSGDQKIYLKRHIWRAFEDATTLLMPLITHE